MEILEKLVTDVTFCKKVTLVSTDFITPTINGADCVAKLIEVKNRSGLDIYVKPNGSDEFPLLDGEDRVVMVKKLSDIQLALQTGGSGIIHLLLEN
jgi:hypothetical protein